MTWSRRTDRQMQAIASAWPWYMQVRICICLLTVSSGKHTEAASRPEAAPSPKLWTVNVLHAPEAVTGERSRTLRPEEAHQQVCSSLLCSGKVPRPPTTGAL